MSLYKVDLKGMGGRDDKTVWVVAPSEEDAQDDVNAILDDYKYRIDDITDVSAITAAIGAAARAVGKRDDAADRYADMPIEQVRAELATEGIDMTEPKRRLREMLASHGITYGD